MGAKGTKNTKYVFGALLAIILFVFIAQFVNASATTVYREHRSLFVRTCTESDDGKDFQNRGEVVYTAKNPQIDLDVEKEFEDTCLTSRRLRTPTFSSEVLGEWYCHEYYAVPLRKVVDCPNGCRNGRCR